MRKHKTSNLLLAVCHKCGKRVLHPRGDTDPKEAIWCALLCEDCGDTGNKDYYISFYGEFGYIQEQELKPATP